MDKNMVHIDDLVRGRLSGGEEPIRPGSWHTMRELLDEKMPTQRPAGGGWGRLARYATVLALLATFTLGGYQMIQATKAHRSGATADEDAGQAGASGSATASRYSNRPAGSVPATEQDDRDGLTAGAQHAADKAGVALATGTASIPASSALGRDGYSDPSSINAGNDAALSTSVYNLSADRNDNSNNNTAGISSAGNTSSRTAGPARGYNAGRDIASAVRTGNQLRNNRNDRHSNLTTGAAASGSRSAAAPGSRDIAPELQGQTSVVIVREVADPLPAASPSADPASVASGAVASTSRVLAGTRQSTGMSSRTPGGQLSSLRPAGNQSASGRMSELIGSGSNINGVVRGNEIRNYDTSRFFVRKDTIQTIKVSYRYYVDPHTGTRSYKTDTVSRTKLIVDRLLLKEMVRSISKDDAEAAPRPAPAARHHRGRKEPNATKEMMKILPAGSARPAAKPGKAGAGISKAQAGASEELVPLSSFRVSSRKSSEPWNPKEDVNNLIRNTRLGLSQMRFYSGIIAGLNTSLGNGANLNGFHLGLTGLLTFNDQWSLMAELKYYQRFNNGYTLRDNYQTGVSNPNAFSPDLTYTSNGTTYNVYNWKRDSMEHYYKFSSLGSLELPIALRYSNNRLSGFAGVNIVYSFRVNAEEVDYRHPVSGRDTIAASGAAAYEQKMTRVQPATVRFENFDPRLGIGYLLGLAYQITPAVSVDLRMTQTLFDNASSSEGGKKVFNSLYKSPNVQISIGYRFSQQPRR